MITAKILERGEFKTALCNMPDYSAGVTEKGSIFIRCYDSAVCITHPGRSYCGNVSKINNIFVKMLPPGTKIQIEVTDDCEEAPEDQL